jgi:hypothetical protein
MSKRKKDNFLSHIRVITMIDSRVCKELKDMSIEMNKTEREEREELTDKIDS